MACTVYSSNLADLLPRVQGPIIRAIIAGTSNAPPVHRAHVLLRQGVGYLEAHLVLAPIACPPNEALLGRDMYAAEMQNVFGEHQCAVEDAAGLRLRWKDRPAVPPEARRYTRIVGISPDDFLRCYTAPHDEACITFY